MTALLAFPGVTITASVVAVGAHYLIGWSWIASGLFGVLIAATDPVSVIAAFKEMQVQPRLALIVESESLLNDGAAAVGFSILLAVAAGTTGSAGSIAETFVWSVAGGVGIGGAVAGFLLLIAGRTEDHLVEITLTTIAAYASFLFAEHIGMSGVLASLTAGILTGNLGWTGPISEQGRQYVISFWEYAAFLANSVVFILIGDQEAQLSLGLFTASAAIAIVLVLLGRMLAVYPLALLVAPTRLKLPGAYQHVLVWGGLRGALALALALALPDSLPERSEIIVTSFAVVAFSILVQGLTMPGLIRRLGLLHRPDDQSANAG